MSNKQPVQGPGQFQWNRGGWFGGQFGGTAWLLPTGLVAFYQAPLLGIIWLSIFSIVNALGFWLWHRRDRIEPFRAIILLLLACTIGGLLALVSLDILRSDRFRDRIFRRDNGSLLQDYRHESLRQGYIFFLVGIPAMAGWFALMERAGRKVRAGQPTRSPNEQTSDSARGHS